MPDAFYLPDGERLVSTELTRGPWDPGSQHAGPPAALLGWALERLPEAADFQIARVTFEILGAVPIAPLGVRAEVVRPGRRVQMLAAELEAEGRVAMRASAWRIRPGEVDLPDAVPAGPVPPGPEAGAEHPFFDTGQELGYHTAMDWSFVSGGFRELGPATCWLRMRQPLVAGEQPTPLQRLLVAADVGNGISSIFQPGRHLFINVDLTVQVERLPAGEWVCVDAVTVAQPHGVGTAESVLYDGEGRVGRGLQTLLISER